jgi:hypothetical protein
MRAHFSVCGVAWPTKSYIAEGFKFLVIFIFCLKYARQK